jgi:RNA polymerase sigma factor (sigma-70 family)
VIVSPSEPPLSSVPTALNLDVAGPDSGVSSLASKSPARVLAELAATQDLAATRQLLDLLAPRMARVAVMVLGTQHPDLDDALQQSLIALVQALPSFRGECEPSTFASRIAVRIAIAHKKRARARAGRVDADHDTEALESPANGAPELAAGEQRKAVLRSLLDELPEEQACAMVFRFMLGWSLEEIGAASNAPTNTIRSRLRLAKLALRRRIESNPTLAELLEVDS